MSTTPMASSALDFLLDEHDLTAPVPGAHLVHAGTSTTQAPQAVHTPVHTPEPLAVHELSPAPPSPGPWAPGSSSPDAAAPVSST
jgi:hypothetical protein